MKTLFAVVALAVMMSSLSYSQTGVSSPNNATFDVDVAIAVTPTAGIWGQLLAGTTYTITADGFITPEDALGASTVAQNLQWDITGAIDANVLISFGLPSFFVSGTGGAHVPYSVGAQSGGWADAPIVAGASYNPIDPRVPSTITLIAGAATVQLGGVLAVPTTATGNYSAQFVLVASNTGL